MSPAWYHALCVGIIAVEVMRPVTLIVYGAALMVRVIRGLRDLDHSQR